MPWKKDEQGNLVIKDGNPVFVYPDGKDVPLDGDSLVGKIAELNSESAARRRELREAQEALKGFEGLDPSEARKALSTVANLDAKKLIDAGEAEKVRTEAIRAVEEKYKPVVEKATALEQALNNEVIGGNFARSKFISEKLVIPGDMVQAQFGKHFKIEDGKMVPYDSKGDKIFSREKPGEVAGFDEALSILVDGYQHKSAILRAKVPDGGGAGPGGGSDRGNINPQIGGNRQERTAAISAKFPGIPEK